MNVLLIIKHLFFWYHGDDLNDQTNTHCREDNYLYGNRKWLDSLYEFHNILQVSKNFLMLLLMVCYKQL
mgnify:CR=1 FL=1